LKDTDCIKYIAESRNIDCLDKPLHKIIDELVDNISSNGLSIMLRILKMPQLRKLAKKTSWGDKIPTNKASLVKKLHDTMEDVGPENFLAGIDSGEMKEILKELEVDVPSSRKEWQKAITKAADNIGLENCLSSFSVAKLKEFVKACDLKVDSDSLESVLQSLMEQENMIAPYEVEGEVPSNKRPEIDKNIRIVDLFHHYFRDDLIIWCESHALSIHGNKKELVERVRRFMMINSWKKIGKDQKLLRKKTE